MKSVLYAIVTVATFPACPVSAQQLWGNLTAGMKVDEVRALQPKSQEPAEKMRFANGVICELEIPSVSIADHNFNACFAFLEGRLHQVYFKSRASPAKADYENVLSYMRDMYGEPESSGATPGGGGYQAEWAESTGVKRSASYITMLAPRVLIVVHQSTKP